MGSSIGRQDSGSLRGFGATIAVRDIDDLPACRSENEPDTWFLSEVLGPDAALVCDNEACRGVENRFVYTEPLRAATGVELGSPAGLPVSLYVYSSSISESETMIIMVMIIQKKMMILAY